jgi:hypothetical protein
LRAIRAGNSSYLRRSGWSEGTRLKIDIPPGRMAKQGSANKVEKR